MHPHVVMRLCVKVSELNVTFGGVTKLYTNLVVIRIKHRGLKFPQNRPACTLTFFFQRILIKTFMMEVLAPGVNLFRAYSLLCPFFRSTGCPQNLNDLRNIIKTLYADDLIFGDTRFSSVRRTYVLSERILSKS